MLIHKDGVLLTSGSELRWYDIRNDVIKWSMQVGVCQIFNLQQNYRFVVVVSFDGLVSVIKKEDIVEGKSSSSNAQVYCQFYA